MTNIGEMLGETTSVLWRPFFLNNVHMSLKKNLCAVAATFREIRDTIRTMVMGLKFKGPREQSGKVGRSAYCFDFICLFHNYFIFHFQDQQSQTKKPTRELGQPL